MTAAGAVAPLLVFGWGNASRGDDALGPLCVERLRAWVDDRVADGTLASGTVDFLDDYQLQVEHALDLAGRQRVLFIDAQVTGPDAPTAPFETSIVLPARDASFSTHAMTPQALLQVYRDVQCTESPPCTLLAIRGERFELGEPPTPAALANLAAAIDWARDWIEA